MDIASLFKEFGYPALMSGVLLWIITVKVERLQAQVQDLKEQLITMTGELREARKDIGGLPCSKRSEK